MIKVGDKLKIIQNLEDHVGYKKGQELTIKSIEPGNYVKVREGDWYIGIEETNLA